MLNSLLANFYERDLNKVIDELNQFKREEDIWKTQGSINNSCGNLTLHIIGGLNYFVGTQLANTGYVRDRVREFSSKGVDRTVLVSELKKLIQLIKATLLSLTEEDMKSEFPIMFDDAKNSKSYVLTQLLVHLNYHLGQINYLRRVFDNRLRH